MSWSPIVQSCPHPGTKQSINCLAQGHNSVYGKAQTSTPRSEVQHSTTQPLCSKRQILVIKCYLILPIPGL